jgi:hypothetical protein
MLPRQLVYVREIGDISGPYWTAATLDGAHLHLEPGEAVLFTSRGDAAQLTAKGVELSQKQGEILPRTWTLRERDATSIVITDRRIAFMTTQFAKGGGWGGFGLVGMTVAVTANAVSKHRAAKRAAGKVLIGQLRYEWLKAVAVRQCKLFSALDAYIHLFVATTNGLAVVELHQLFKPKVIDEKLGRWLVGAVAHHRTQLMTPTENELAILRNLQTIAQEPVDGARPFYQRWTLPGRTDELIASAIAKSGVGAAP